MGGRSGSQAHGGPEQRRQAVGLRQQLLRAARERGAARRRNLHAFQVKPSRPISQHNMLVLPIACSIRLHLALAHSTWRACSTLRASHRAGRSNGPRADGDRPNTPQARAGSGDVRAGRHAAERGGERGGGGVRVRPHRRADRRLPAVALRVEPARAAAARGECRRVGVQSGAAAHRTVRSVR
eukprot:65808-Rhodomonas_salina.1